MGLAVIERHAGAQSLRGLLVACGLAVLAGCASPSGSSVQVVDRNQRDQVNQGHYIVRAGDTLYSIAFRFGWDWKELARRNGIDDPYIIYPGQRIRFDLRGPTVAQGGPALGSAPVATPVPIPPPLTSGPVTSTPAPAPAPVPAPAPPSVAQPVVRAPAPEQPVVVSPSVAATTPVQPVARSASGWAWPSNGPVISRFAETGSLNKGVDIAGDLGQPVLAASDGTVVYAGSGLRGYGELVIIKHNDTYVSAYGHNRRLLVREGQRVKVGQAIAEMGSTGTDRVKLHFEIRRQGKPVDPLQYLPRR